MKLVIIVKGGIVQRVLHDMTPVDVVVLDQDLQDSENGIIEIEGNTYIEHEVEPELDPEFIQKYNECSIKHT